MTNEKEQENQSRMVTMGDPIDSRTAPANEVVPSRVHELKVLPPFFDALEDGRKTFEIRFNDRDYQVGDVLRLREYTPAFQFASGREKRCRVTYMTNYAQCVGYVVMAIVPA